MLFSTAAWFPPTTGGGVAGEEDADEVQGCIQVRAVDHTGAGISGGGGGGGGGEGKYTYTNGFDTSGGGGGGGGGDVHSLNPQLTRLHSSVSKAPLTKNVRPTSNVYRVLYDLTVKGASHHQ